MFLWQLIYILIDKYFFLVNLDSKCFKVFDRNRSNDIVLDLQRLAHASNNHGGFGGKFGDAGKWWGVIEGEINSRKSL